MSTIPSDAASRATVLTPPEPTAPGARRTPRWARLLLVAVCAFAVLFLSAGLLAARAVVHGGLVAVTVHQADGLDLDVSVPAALVHAGIVALPALAGEDIWTGVRTDLGPWRPAAAAALRSLDEAPDAVLVDVEDNGERVRIVKEGSTLRLHVEGREGVFSVTLPAGVLRHIAREIA